MQSIGRVMRKSKESGSDVYVNDVIDVLKNDNYCLNHFWERLNIYQKDQHPIKEIEKEI
jgi:hypothetical protein